MTKDIKTKETIKKIKENDKKRNLRYFEKKITMKKQASNQDEEYLSSDAPKDYAINKTIDAEKQATFQTRIKTKKLVNKIKRVTKQKRLQSYDQINSNDKTIHQAATHSKDKQDVLIKSKNVVCQPKINNVLKSSSSIHDMSQHNYNESMKSQMIAKIKKKILEIRKTSSVTHMSEKGISKIFKGTFYVTKKAITGIHNLIAIGIGFIILVTIVLFIGVFSALSDDSSVDTSLMYVSEDVLKYTEVIEKYAQEYEVSEYVSLIQAVMMQESGGKGNDPMQASESEYNDKYPKEPNGINDPDYSIKVGIHYLSDCLKKANVDSPSNIENISLALQGYNYGNGYIQWAIDYFGGYTRANAKVFSDEMKAKLQVSVYGDPNYVAHVLRYYHIGNGDIVSIAKSQIGNVGGKTYWSWYGFDSHVEWCAIFVSWCANESGDLNVTIPKFSKVEDGITWFKDNKKWADKNHMPKSSDLIFFDWNNDNDPDHVGIVESVNNGYVYTVEGNSSDECKEKQYKLDNKTIIGYGVV